MICLTFLNASQDREKCPFQVLPEHISDDRLACLPMVAPCGLPMGHMAVLSSHFAILSQDLNYNPASFEEREQDELERFFDVAHE